MNVKKDSQNRQKKENINLDFELRINSSNFAEKNDKELSNNITNKIINEYNNQNQALNKI